MKRVKRIIFAVVIGILVLGAADGKRTKTRVKSSGSRTNSRTTPRTRIQPTPTHQDVDPNKIGWQVPGSNSQNTRNTGNTAAKPSAPLPDQHIASKTSATSLQSGYPGSSYPGQGSNTHQSPGNFNGQQHGQSYNPPVGQQYQPNSHPYNPSVGQQYHPNGQAYNPSSYHQTPGQAYNPPAGPSYHQPYGQPYNPPAAPPPYQQPYGQPYNPPVQQPQTIFVQPAQAPSSNRGLGQIAKEAVVFAGVSAGVNAAVNRLLPGGSRGSAGTTSNTQITYNNYYNNGTDSQGNPVAQPNPQPAGAAQPNPGPAAAAPPPQPAAGAAQPPTPDPANPMKPASGTESDKDLSVIPLNGVSPTPAQVNPAPANPDAGNPSSAVPAAAGNVVSDADIETLTEELFKKDVNNAFKYVTLKTQGQKMDDSVTDDASEPLLTVQSEALEIATISKLRSLYDKYEFDSEVAEKITPEKRSAEREFLDAIASTDVMKTAMKFVANKGLILDDEDEIKDALKRIWFSQFPRANNVVSSSGFEDVFLAEKVGTEVSGLHNWVYFNDQETKKKVDYLGYIKEVKLGDKGAIVKLRAKHNDIVRPVTTIFVGTSPELEMALYTTCYYVRPNSACPISLGGTKFTIYTGKIIYFGKELMFLAYPEI